MTAEYILSIDQGTTSSRAILFDLSGVPIAQHQLPITQTYPNNGWVEHDPMEILQTVVTCCQQVVKSAGLTWSSIIAVGISNQRETTICWDKQTGQPVYPAIVWQDRRTAADCQALQSNYDLIRHITDSTGLKLDPYFSATKIKWILENVEGSYERAKAGDLLFGTIDSFLIWHLTDGQVHATDATNASRTLLFNIKTQHWNETLLKQFDIPSGMLPEVKDSNAMFGITSKALLGAELPITGVAGDQQAALVGQACFNPGMVKSTYGTGCFMMMNTGTQVVRSQHQLISTVAYRLNGEVTYAIEGSIFVAGSAVQWLRDTLRLIQSAEESSALAESVPDTNGVYLVPAFTGLGAPYWDPDARGAILGLTRDTGIAHIVRAALEAVCYQSADLLEAIQDDAGQQYTNLRVDGGMAVNDWFMQFLSDICHVNVERPVCVESSALGAAMLAGLGAGCFRSLSEIGTHWRQSSVFRPKMSEDMRGKMMQSWRNAVKRIVK